MAPPRGLDAVEEADRVASEDRPAATEASEPPTVVPRRWTTLALKVAVTGAGVAFLALTTDLGDAARAITGAAPGWALLALSLLTGCVYFSAWRWQRLLLCDEVEISRRELLLVYLESCFFGLFLPSAVGGDLFRGWRIHGAVGGTRRTAVNLVVERIVGVSSLGLLGLVAIPFASDLESKTYSGLVITSVVALAIAAVLLSPRVARIGSRIAGHLRLARISTLLRHIADQIHGYRRQRSLLPTVLALSVLQHLVATAALACAGMAVGLDLGFEIYLAAVPILSLVSLLPSIGGIGPREVSVAYVLESAGAGGGPAVAVAAVFLAAMVGRGLIGGLVYLTRRPPPEARPGL
jgi:hypothetical protein